MTRTWAGRSLEVGSVSGFKDKSKGAYHEGGVQDVLPSNPGRR